MSHVNRHAGTSANAFSDSVEGGYHGSKEIPRRIVRPVGMAEHVLRMTACRLVLYSVTPTTLHVMLPLPSLLRAI